MADALTDAVEEDCSVELVPARFDAGAEIAVRVILTGPAARRLSGQSFGILDETGKVRGRLTLVAGEGGTAQGEATVRAPDRRGDYVWTARPEAGRDGGQVDHPAFDLAFMVGEHALSVVVWDTPLAVDQKKPFTVRIGLRCSAGCDLSKHRIELSDDRGGPPISCETGDTPWPGTEALYWTEVELEAPAKEGQAGWNIAAEVDDAPQPHTDVRTQFAVNVVPRAEHLLTVTAVDAETSAPIPRAKVVAHPFRTLTDAAGRAELHLPPGPRRLFVSGPDHIPYQIEGDVTGDMKIDAALQRDIPMSEAEIWT